MSRRTPSDERRDEGAVLPLVLVMIVISGLMVVPLLNYSVTVFRANNVVADRTRGAEAAKGGLRVALSDPKQVFLECDNGGNLTPSGDAATINGISVVTTCSELEEVGPIEALNLEVPTGAVVMQLGAQVPVSLDGSATQSPAVPPYPVAPEGADWWAIPARPDPLAQYSNSPETDKIWIPDLPRRPPNARSSTPFTMPGSFGCSVFFPGYYPDPLTVPQGRVYFTSGVYYFEDVVTIEGDADVVVGYGLEDFAPASDCADDIQVASNVVENPGSFDISGGGATWVFGGDGRLVVDNTATTSSLSVRFNQRYDDADRGGRISIMTVNGDDSDPTDPEDHVVTNVNEIPRSLVLDGDVRESLVGSGYLPSNSSHTDKARAPAEPANFTVEGAQGVGTATDRALAVLSWDAVAGQEAGGAFLGRQDAAGNWVTPPYEVEYRREFDSTWIPACDTDAQTTAPKPDPDDGDRVTCVIAGLDMNTPYRFQIRTVNEVGESAWSFRNNTVTPSNPVVTAPGAPASVTVQESDRTDVAQVSWDAPLNDGGLPVTEYRVTASTIELVPHPNAGPVAAPLGSERLTIEQRLVGANSATAQLRIADPNGDELALAIDTSALPAGLTALADDTTDTVSVTVDDVPTAGSDLSLTGPYVIPYIATDPSGEAVSGDLTVDVVPALTTVPSAPVADVLTLSADVGVPITARVPASDADGLPFDPVPVVVDSSALDVAEWSVVVSGTEVTITSTADDGTYSIPYEFVDGDGNVAASTIEVTVVRSMATVGGCSVVAEPEVSLVRSCEIENMVPLVAGTPTLGFQGYRFDVEAVNAAGTSPATVTSSPHPTSFGGGGSPLPATAERVLEPWIPERNVVDVIATGVNPVVVEIAGYVATPMGRLAVDNPHGHDIEIKGGVMTGTFDIDDARADGTTGSVPIGFKNDIVLQRKVRIVSTADGVTSIAIVQVNEDGAAFEVNEWVVG